MSSSDKVKQTVLTYPAKGSVKWSTILERNVGDIF